MKYLQPANNPSELLEQISRPDQPPLKRMFRPDFHHLLGKMPIIDATKTDQSREIEITKEVMHEIEVNVLDVMKTMDLPEIPDYGFGRVILAIEEPKYKDGQIITGTEVVLALWGKGFQSPVHGHQPGFINETLISGSFDVDIYKGFGPLKNRQATFDRRIEQSEPGLFYREFVQEVGQEERSSVIHNFRATKSSASLHYLPEHVRDGNANRFQIVNSPESNSLPPEIINQQFNKSFDISQSDVEVMDINTLKSTMTVGDVYLVRSQNVAILGDHYVLITGGYRQKKHGYRPEDISFPVSYDIITPLNKFGPHEELVIMRVSDSKRHEFYEAHKVDYKYRRD